MDSIEDLIKQGKKTWIQEKTKIELIEIANKLAHKTIFSDSNSIQELRTYLRNYIDGLKAKFLSTNMAIILKPLYDCLKKIDLNGQRNVINLLIK